MLGVSAQPHAGLGTKEEYDNAILPTLATPSAIPFQVNDERRPPVTPALVEITSAHGLPAPPRAALVFRNDQSSTVALISTGRNCEIAATTKVPMVNGPTGEAAPRHAVEDFKPEGRATLVAKMTSYRNAPVTVILLVMVSDFGLPGLFVL